MWGNAQNTNAQRASIGSLTGNGRIMQPTKLVRNLLLAMLMAAGATAMPAFAQISFNVIIAPPAPRYEPVPVVAPGYVWAPGYWGWNGDHHVWVRGRPIVERVGYRWAPDRWEQRGSGYYRHPGNWERDANYRVVKAKKEKKPKHRDNHNRGDDNEHGRGNDGNHGRGDGHGR